MRFTSVLLLPLSLLSGALIGCTAQDAAALAPEPTVLTVEAVAAHSQPGFSFHTTLYGRIQPARRTPLAFEIAGQVTAVLVDEGDTIAAGDPVARLDTTILEAEREKLLAAKTIEQAILRRLEKGEREEVIAAARAMVSKLDAELEQAIRDRQRSSNLRDRNAVTESEYEAALFRAKSLQASLDAAKARLLELETGTREEDIDAQKNRLLELDAQIAVLDTRLEKAVITAPFTAIVIRRIIDEGAVVQDGQAILVLSETSQHEARFSVPLAQLGEAEEACGIRVGTVAVPVHAVRTIPSVSRDTRTIDVIFTLKPHSSVIEGQTCALDVTQKVVNPCVHLPHTALVPSVRGLWSVYRLEPEDSGTFRVLREEVTVNHTDGTQVYVEASLPDGALVVSEGAHKVVPGMRVRTKDVAP
ncbi:putative efflux pump membrane fusion protein [Maioricimonas rarisocia]|uniref:Putative efflux pump membrane fusion protein n=1 Tax=Maioricimonas rarisocia TaxID=2528026 RepID=A0A517Z0H4_9PLAN|nr:biotin/lipoyl-binding protein [Maioricimonas rarisocia]QDU35955.1 putative efflux pump membrane fusion protein [Maioricimonas rarisocia]